MASPLCRWAVIAGRRHHGRVADRDPRTGRIVSTAAAFLSVTFFAFALSKISFIQFFGLGTEITILLDATVIRGLLVPAVMSAVGERIWWAPKGLRRLYRLIGFVETPAALDPS